MGVGRVSGETTGRGPWSPEARARNIVFEIILLVLTTHNHRHKVIVGLSYGDGMWTRNS